MIEELNDNEINTVISSWLNNYDIHSLNHETKVLLISLRSKLVKKTEKLVNDELVVEFINYVLRFDTLDINKFIKAIREDNLQKV